MPKSNPLLTAHGSLDILYIGTLPPYPGGAAISCSQLLVGLARLGHRVRALAPMIRKARCPASLFVDNQRAIDVNWYSIPYFETTPELLPTEAFLRQETSGIRRGFASLIGRARPDVILVGREIFARYVPKIARAQALPCVLMTRGHPTWAILKGVYPEAFAQQLLAEYRKADLIIAVSRHMASGLRRLGFANVKSIPNAVDLDQFEPRPKSSALLRDVGVDEADIVVMHVSKLTPGKRPLQLVESATEALQQERRLLYVIVGDGPLRSHMERACAEHKIQDRFRFTGTVNYSQVPDYINLADIVVMPSASEGMARVYLETQACGRVLVASDIPAATEVIKHGETGLLYRSGDISDLTAKTVLTAADPKLRNAIGNKARQRVQAHSVTQAVARYSEALQAVVANYGRE